MPPKTCGLSVRASSPGELARPEAPALVTVGPVAAMDGTAVLLAAGAADASGATAELPAGTAAVETAAGIASMPVAAAVPAAGANAPAPKAPVVAPKPGPAAAGAATAGAAAAALPSPAAVPAAAGAAAASPAAVPAAAGAAAPAAPAAAGAATDAAEPNAPAIAGTIAATHGISVLAARARANVGARLQALEAALAPRLQLAAQRLPLLEARDPTAELVDALDVAADRRESEAANLFLRRQERAHV